MRQILLYFTATALLLVSAFAAEDLPVEQVPEATEAPTAETAAPSNTALQADAELPDEPAAVEPEESTDPEATDETTGDVAVSEADSAATDVEAAETPAETSPGAPPPEVPVVETPAAPVAAAAANAAADEAARAETAKAINEMMRAETDALISRMSVMEQFLIAQHDREIELYRDTIRLVTTFGVAFAVIAGLGLLAAAFLNYRALMAVQGVMVHAQVHPQIQSPSTGLLPSGENVPGIERVQASGQRFHSEMSSLDQRLSELEHMAAGREHPSAHSGALGVEKQDIAVTSVDASLEPPPQRVVPRAAILAHKAQALMNLGKLNEALETLDEAGTLEDARSDVCLTRGKVLEKLGKLDSAIEAFDEASKCDEANTNALLMKAGVLNRQERYSEALECYEQALAAHRLAT
jgi:tetratricopeptide (TPR) repeat protein